MLNEINRKRSDFREILYHYTDFEAFSGILRDRELRVNNVLNMNDSAEMELFMSGFFDAVISQMTKDEGSAKAERLEALFAEEKKKYFDYSAYAACFSGYRDDASQWERYANRGKGVCIGFRRDLLEKMCGGVISLQKVFYQDDIKTHPLVREFCRLMDETDDVSYSNERLHGLLREAWQNAASFKHPSFSSEMEVRLVVMPFESPDFDVKPRYHITKERIKKYYPLDLEAMCADAGVSLGDLITEIIIGPESTQSLPILADFLEDMGFAGLKGKLGHSRCPLRSRM